MENEILSLYVSALTENYEEDDVVTTFPGIVAISKDSNNRTFYYYSQSSKKNTGLALKTSDYIFQQTARNYQLTTQQGILKAKISALCYCNNIANKLNRYKFRINQIISSPVLVGNIISNQTLEFVKLVSIPSLNTLINNFHNQTRIFFDDEKFIDDLKKTNVFLSDRQKEQVNAIINKIDYFKPSVPFRYGMAEFNYCKNSLRKLQIIYNEYLETIDESNPSPF